MAGRKCEARRLSPPLASVTKRHYIIRTSRRAEGGPGRKSMPARFRAGLVAALFVFATAPLTPAQSAEKTFQDPALDDEAIKLEADLKDEAGTVVKQSSRSRRMPTRRLRKTTSRAPPTSTSRSSRSRRTTRKPGGGSPISGSRSLRPKRMMEPRATNARPLPPISLISVQQRPRKRPTTSSCSPMPMANAPNGAPR